MLRRAPMTAVQHTTAASTSEGAVLEGLSFAVISARITEARRRGTAVDAVSKRARHCLFLALRPFG